MPAAAYYGEDASTIGGQGWRQHQSEEGRQRLRAKLEQYQSKPTVVAGSGFSHPQWYQSAVSNSIGFTESWAARDKSIMSADRRAALERRAGLDEDQIDAAESMMADTLLLMLLVLAAAFLMAFFYVLLKRRGLLHDDFLEEKAFPNLGKSAGFSLSNVELVQQALIVMRHKSTCTLHRVLDVAEVAAEYMGTSVSSFTKQVRQTSRQMKKDDPDIEPQHSENPDIDILQLNKPHKTIPDAQWIMDDMADECNASSLDIETLQFIAEHDNAIPNDIPNAPVVVDTVMSSAESPMVTVQPVVVPEVIQSDDVPTKAAAQFKARPNDLEPIDELLSKTTALL
eukprot:gnl/MRDRNA2_/MRDRNA2_119480_c0_seq1.p1 gnl/MRDRNA2_/MRDRNA2_119480_c0~~gnl/MRDRNA2_/MRDRNA2_119480_c0_seq1.p1  ORF type:complete len:393 (+),score=80.11 gnl/MRDRNA2_/MRDRNA2_119480_c0_seq1:161-1180(+)